MNIYLCFHYVLIVLMEIAHAQRALFVNDITTISIRISLEKRFHFPCEKTGKKCSLWTSEQFQAAVENPKNKYQHILALSCQNFFLLPFCNQSCFLFENYVPFPAKI